MTLKTTLNINLFLISISLLCLQLVSCQAEHPSVTEKEMLERLSVVDPNTRLLPDQIALISCQQYAHCHKVMRAQFLGYEIFLVELSSSTYAKDLAAKLKARSLGQWLFDNIQGETPILQALDRAISMTPLQLQEEQQKLSAQKKAAGGGGH